MDITRIAKQQRKPEHDVAEIFVGRWSPRAMTGEGLSDGELMTLFEAAKWAPSSYNEQPWRILYARRDTKEWDLFFNLMVEFNQSWTKNAAALFVILSKKISSMNGKPLPTHSFDTGAAWENLALQGALRGLVVHGMSGFDYDKAARDLNIPQEFRVEVMAAVGRPAAPDTLPEALRSKEAPSDRRPLEKSVAHGVWSEKLA